MPLMDNIPAAERRDVEIELLQAMYPDQVDYNAKSCELKYRGTIGGSIALRIPEAYPEEGLPDLVAVTDINKSDVRSKMTSVLKETNLSPGEEVLDAIILAFEDLLASSIESDDVKLGGPLQKNNTNDSGSRSKTVVVWLHHLLNTNKRKLALNPTLTAAADGGIVSGITKPGYPGILVYSGPMVLVDAHVAELKQQRWQAFQVRFEEESGTDEMWSFEHGSGIREVESMSDLVHSIIGESNKEAFLRATGVK